MCESSTRAFRLYRQDHGLSPSRRLLELGGYRRGEVVAHGRFGRYVIGPRQIRADLWSASRLTFVNYRTTVDDDEWQVSAWFFRDQDKEAPLASLDFDQHLFAVTGTFRAAQDDEGYDVYSRDHFFDMFGPLPASFKPEDIGSLTVCPYDYDKDTKQWTNQITGYHPLVFHFAGNDWLCACTVFAAEGFTGITGKFRNNCEFELAKWYDIVQNGIQYIASVDDPAIDKSVREGDELIAVEPKAVADVALDEDPSTENMVHQGDELIDADPSALAERRLDGYDMEAEDTSDRRSLQMKMGPYRRQLGDRQLQMKMSPYRRQLGDRGDVEGEIEYDESYEHRALQTKMGPYRRQLGDRGDMDGSVEDEVSHDDRRQLQMMMTGPYRRQLGEDRADEYMDEEAEDAPYYHRQLQMMKMSPYRRLAGDRTRGF
jgi:hypothetical protein